jgi:hypothetical protein
VGTPLISVVDPSGSWGCTGTMVASRWMLTAHHCVTQEIGGVGQITGGTAIAPGNLTARLNGGTNVATGVLIVRHPTLDAGLVLLNTAPLTGAGQSRINRFYRGSTSALVSQSFYTQGWGNNSITQCTPGFGGSGFGTLRTATLSIASMIDAGHFNITPNGSGQIEWTGDSGSSLYTNVASLTRPNGVESTGNCTQSPLKVTAIQHVRGDAIRSWVEGVTGASPAAGSQAGYERADNGASAVPFFDATTNHVKELCAGGQCTSVGWQIGDLVQLTGAPNAASNVSSFIRNDSLSTVVYITSAGHVEALTLSGSTWSAKDIWTDAGATVAAAAGANPVGYTRADNSTDVVYRGTNGNVFDIFFSPGATHWSFANLSSISGATVAAASDPVGYARNDTSNDVVYRGTDNKIYDIYLTPGSSWAFANLSALSSASVAASGTPRPFSRADGSNDVLFRGTDNNVYDIYLTPGLGWAFANLTSLSGAPVTASDPAPYVRSDSSNDILFRGTDNNIYDIFLSPAPTSGWKSANLSSLSGAPVSADTPSGYVRADGVNAVNYKTSDNHVHEIRLTPSGWVHSDLTPNGP